MASNDPPGPRPRRTTEPGDDDDALSRLQERLDRASEAAERLIAEAAARATRTPPPSGWQTPEPEGAAESAGARARGEVDLLLQFVQSLRELIPPELQRRLTEALRELLLALRALIDWYLERSQRRRTEPAQVQDIPIL
jgi:hypothetical protein